MLSHQKIVHIHPSLLCNFKCLHCYSSSGPRKHTALDVGRVLDATGQLRRFGYGFVSLSGGEPTLYPDLEVLCRGLSGQGYSVSVISNGWDVTRLVDLLNDGFVQFAAVSIDGMNDLHDRIRQRRGSFAAAFQGLAALRAGSHSVGAVVAVTAHSMGDLPEIVERLVDHGAAKIQLHPLAAVGRAREDHGIELSELAPEALVRLLLMGEAFRNTWPDVEFQTDAMFGAHLRGRARSAAGDVITPLVIDERGRLLPLAHGVSPAFQLGSIGTPIAPPVMSPPLRQLVEETVIACSNMTATCFFSELVRRSLAHGTGDADHA